MRNDYRNGDIVRVKEDLPDLLLFAGDEHNVVPLSYPEGDAVQDLKLWVIGLQEYVPVRSDQVEPVKRLKRQHPIRTPQGDYVYATWSPMYEPFEDGPGAPDSSAT